MGDTGPTGSVLTRTDEVTNVLIVGTAGLAGQRQTELETTSGLSSGDGVLPELDASIGISVVSAGLGGDNRENCIFFSMILSLKVGEGQTYGETKVGAQP